MTFGAKARAAALVLVPAALLGAFALWPFGKSAAPLGCAPLTAPGPRAPGSTEAAGAGPGTIWTPVPRSAAAGSRAFVFWEAEFPRSSSYPASNPFAPANATEADALSGGAWIGADAPSTEQFLEYDVKIEESGRYTFYARKFWQHGPFRYRFDAGPWVEIGEDVALLDGVVLRRHVVANWIEAGDVELTPGSHVLHIEVSKAYARGVSAWDAFLLTRAPFVPRGKLKPGDPSGPAPDGAFVFEPEPDPFERAELDLRRLNGGAAGEHGFVVVENDAFVFEKTRAPVRFWGVNASPSLLTLPRGRLRSLARHLSKRGVNLVRVMDHFHRPDDPAKLDEKKLLNLHALVAELEREGIYTELAIYFPLEFRPQARHGFPGYDGEKSAFGLLFFDRGFQALYRGWWRQLLGFVNPETGTSLAEEPALAAIELVNEDSTLFWTFRPYVTPPAEQMPELERRFGAWLASRHGSFEKAVAAFGGKPRRGDHPAEGRVGLAELGSIVSGDGARERATAEFLARILRDFYRETYRYLKQDLGFRASIACSNWITADPRRLGPLDKWANTACDFVDRHGYYSGPHLGDSASYLISKGDRYDDASALCFDSDSEKREERKLDLPIRDVRYDGKPSTISELNWTPPNRFRAEQPFLAAAYGSLHGTNAFAFFTVAEPFFAQTESKFSVNDPAVLGQFPATALLYRNGYVRAGAKVIELSLGLGELFALGGSPLAGSENLDLLRKADVPAGASAAGSAPAIEPLFYLAGRAEVRFGAAGGSARVADLSAFVDRDARRVKSTTGELVWDYGAGVARLEAERAAGVAGFLGRAGSLELRAFRLDTELDYGVVLLVSLDGEPLRTSRRMLLQVMTELENRGFHAPGQGLRTIADVGRPPLVVKNVQGRVRFTRADAAALRALALDANGYATRRAELSNGLTLLPDVLHYIVFRE